MSYQIKSTPYFRRMFNNSKKNGQLQRLREEYERIQEFNDRTIELKMRQVRLKRLFREIEEIKEGGGGGGGTSSVAANRVVGGGGGGSSSPTSISHSARRRHHHHQHHQQQHQHRHNQHYNSLSAGNTPEQRRHHQRAEALIRSRELGKALSRRNAQMNEAGVGGYLRSDLLRSSAKIRAVADSRRDAQERRERAAKRISYGNDQSRQNLQRQLKVCQRRLTAKFQAQKSPERGTNRVRSGYQHITPSQLDLMVDAEDLAAEQQRYFREQVEDELQLAEERFRREEKRLCMEAVGSSITSEEEEDGQEELRFLRGEQAMSESEVDDDDEVNNEVKVMGRLRRDKLQQDRSGYSGDHKYKLTLAEEHFRLESNYSDDEQRQEVYQEDEDQDDDDEREMMPQQVDKKKEAEEEQHSKSSHLPPGRFSVSSSAIGTAQSVLGQYQHYQQASHQPVSTATVLSSDQEMVTAPLANEEQIITTPVTPRSINCRTASEADDLPAINNWRRVSLTMPWFKVFNPRKSHSDCSRSLGSSIRVEQLQKQAKAEQAKAEQAKAEQAMM